MGIREINATYNVFRAFKNEPTDICFAISEFVDNSISSFLENNKVESLDLKNCKIGVQIIKNNEKESLVVFDNANGMSEDELSAAIEPFQMKESNKLNTYGVGMKLACFYLGETVKIYSKRKNCVECMLELDLTKHDNNEKAIVESVTSNENKLEGNSSGTYIKISNIYKDRIIEKNDEELWNIIHMLEIRYGRYIEKGLEIYIQYILNGKQEIYKKARVFPYTPYSKRNLIEILRFNEQKVKFDENEINDYKITLSQNERENLSKVGARYIEEKFNNSDDLFFSFEGKVGETIVSFNWGILSFGYGNGHKMLSDKTYSLLKYNGMSIFHCNRGIRHNPNSTGGQDNANSLSAYPFTKSILSAGSANTPLRRLYGDVDLTNLKASTTDKNKRNLKWDPIEEADFKKHLENIAKFIVPFTTKLLEFEDAQIKKNTNKTIQTKTKEKVVNELGFFTPNIKTTRVQETDQDIWHGKIKNVNLDFSIKIMGPGADEDSNYLDYDLKGNECIILINPNHYVFKKLCDKDIFNFLPTIVPLCLAFTCIKLYQHTKDHSLKDSLEKIFNNRDISQILDNIFLYFKELHNDD